MTFIVYHPIAGIWISRNRFPTSLLKYHVNDVSACWLMIPPATWECE